MSRKTCDFPDGSSVTIKGTRNTKKIYIIVGQPINLDVMYYYIKPELNKDDDSRGIAVRASTLKKAPTRVKHITRRKPKVKTKKGL